MSTSKVVKQFLTDLMRFYIMTKEELDEIIRKNAFSNINA